MTPADPAIRTDLQSIDQKNARALITISSAAATRLQTVAAANTDKRT